MWKYYLKLSWLSIRSTPILSALMVVAIATGIAASLTTLTLYAVISSNPMAHKNDSLFRLQLDSWSSDGAFRSANEVPTNLTYQDAKAIYAADIADQTLLMARAGLTLESLDKRQEPRVEPTRLATNSFFDLFDVEFIYGRHWNDRADTDGARMAVISESVNNRMFNGKDSVGDSILLEGEIYTVIGVVADSWSMIPNVYDVHGGAFKVPPQIYIPFFNLERRNFSLWSGVDGWKFENINSHRNFLDSELVWVQSWVSLTTPEQVASFNQFIRNYISQQKQIGRFERPSKYYLSSPERWLEINDVVSRDNQILVVLSFAFLLVCLVNAIVLLLAKFLRKAPEAGLRRALGASRGAIFAQHMTEAAAIGAAGGLLGLVLAWLGLLGIRSLYSDYQAVAVMGLFTLLAALALAIISSLFSGLVPAWQIARAQPSRYLKTQ